MTSTPRAGSRSRCARRPTSRRTGCTPWSRCSSSAAPRRRSASRSTSSPRCRPSPTGWSARSRSRWSPRCCSASRSVAARAGRRPRARRGHRAGQRQPGRQRRRRPRRRHPARQPPRQRRRRRRRPRPAPRRVEVLVRRDGRACCCSRSADSGPGLDADQAREAFARGWSTKPVGPGRPQGRGLGLALVGQTVRRLGGTVEVGRRGGGAVHRPGPARAARAPREHRRARRGRRRPAGARCSSWRTSPSRPQAHAAYVGRVPGFVVVGVARTGARGAAPARRRRPARRPRPARHAPARPARPGRRAGHAGRRAPGRRRRRHLGPRPRGGPGGRAAGDRAVPAQAVRLRGAARQAGALRRLPRPRRAAAARPAGRTRSTGRCRCCAARRPGPACPRGSARRRSRRSSPWCARGPRRPPRSPRPPARARVTVRRYLEHLADTGVVARTPRYGVPGRPEVEYRWVDGDRPGSPARHLAALPGLP